MCEHYVARAAEPFRLDELWQFTEQLERYGIAGFGWGASWISAEGKIQSHRDIGAFKDDQARDAVGAVETTAALVHLRRPSKLSTLGIADTQPFDDPAGRFSFSHNGDFRKVQEWRVQFRTAGRIHGRADTEVGARWLEDAWDGAAAGPPGVLATLHETFGGQANLSLLTADGGVRRLRGQHRESGLHVPSRPDRNRLYRDLLPRPEHLPVRRARCDRAAARPRR